MAQKYNLPDAYKGDTYLAVQFTILENSVALDLTGSTIKTTFRKESKKGIAVKTISNTNGITITDATNGVFEFDQFDLDWEEGDYYYDIQITSATNVITTYISGIIKVTLDIT